MRVCAIVTFCVLATCALATDRFPPLFPASNDVAHCEDATLQNFDLYYTQLEASPQMPAQEVSLRVGIPFENLTTWFDRADLWTSWNHLFASNGVTNYSLCAPFNNVSYTNGPPVDPPFPADLQAPHFIDQHGFNKAGDQYAFGWNFQLTTNGTMIVFGRHTFTLRPLVDQSGNKATIVSHWEKAAGSQLDTAVNQNAWTIALQESLLDTVNGFVCLERVFKKNGKLEAATVAAACHPFKP
jgi:hypothetical protein